MKLAVMSDLHLMKPGEPECGQRLGSFAVPLLRAALQKIEARGDVSAVCLAGDCVNSPDNLDGLCALHDLVSKFTACPVIAIPGNHDPHPDQFFTVFHRYEYLDIPGARIIPFCDEQRPGWHAERMKAEFSRTDRLCSEFGGAKIFLQHVPLYPPDAPHLRYGYLNAAELVASMKRNGAVLSVSGHQHEGIPVYHQDGMYFSCAPALCEPPFQFLILDIEPSGLTTSEVMAIGHLPG